ncbi:MAG: hypothetical protein COT73_12535 [Bdellovibrio sp. CG10_big_fil_rev_8_21_14_0_10_47_8]|nr:MAG: hypothetical protein COT73_12535 [Bdellovibrio sp. CG10_big_fil_rev_8_21_14_0_10_47_8]
MTHPLEIFTAFSPDAFSLHLSSCELGANLKKGSLALIASGVFFLSKSETMSVTLNNTYLIVSI